MADDDVFTRWPHLVYRKTEWYPDPYARILALTILEHCAWDTREFKGVELKPGQVWTSIRALARWTGLTERRTRTALGRLIQSNFATQKVTHSGTLLTVTNYKAYGRASTEADTANDTRCVATTAHTRIDINKQDIDDAYARTLRAEWKWLSNAGPWNESSEKLAREWQEQGIPLEVAAASIRLGAARSNGKISSLKYFEGIFKEAEEMLRTEPSYIHYITSKLEAKRRKSGSAALSLSELLEEPETEALVEHEDIEEGEPHSPLQSAANADKSNLRRVASEFRKTLALMGAPDKRA